MSSFNRLKSQQIDEQSGDATLKLSSELLLKFTEKLQILLESGIDLTKSLTTLSKKYKDETSLFTVLTGIIEELDRGKSFSEALRRFPAAFPLSYTEMMAAAEQSGSFTSNEEDADSILDLIISSIRRELKTKSEIKTKSRYPMIVLTILIAALIVLAYFVLPPLKVFFLSSGVIKPEELFFMTRWLFNICDFLDIYWYLPPLIITAFIAVIIYYFKSEAGKKNLELWLLKIKLFQNLYIAETLSIFSSMIGAGIPLQKSLQITMDCAQNHVIKAALKESLEATHLGESLSEALRRSHPLFAGETNSIIFTGEESGRLDSVLKRYSDDLFNEVDEEIKIKSEYITPALICIIAVPISFIVIAFWGGLFSIAAMAKH